MARNRKKMYLYVEEFAEPFLRNKLKGVCEVKDLMRDPSSPQPYPNSTDYVFSILIRGVKVPDDLGDNKPYNEWVAKEGKTIVAQVKKALSAKEVALGNWDIFHNPSKSRAYIMGTYVSVTGGVPLPPAK